MESLFGSRNRHLDASSGREVVFCHACLHEWYNDERDALQCPRCGSGAAEIVEPGNDPRGDRDIPSLAFPSNRTERRRPSDSDPEEADIDGIDDHLRASPVRSNLRPGAGGNSDGDDIFRRFADMFINDLGAGRLSRSESGSLFGPRPGEELDPFSAIPNPRTHGPTTIHRTTFRSGPVSGSATFAIISSNTTGPAGAGVDPFPPGFPTLFGQIVNNATPPGGTPPGGATPGADDPNRPVGAGPRPHGNVGFGLQELLALLNPAAGVLGDAVYSQEALDRIITTLMEANPQSNAAPPASQAAIDRLEKKKVDDKMLGPEGKAECTICIDDLNKGDEVTVLPCSHWFHGECVTLWLKEHNTCPICRAPIEQRDSQTSAPRQPQAQSAEFADWPAEPFYTRPSPQMSGLLMTRQHRNSHNPSWSQERRYRAAGTSSGLPRRSSLSPPSRQMFADRPVRSRARSPSSSRDQDGGVSPYDRGDYFTSRSSSTRDNRERENHNTQSSGHGPLSWLRDHLGRGSGNGSDRDRRR